MTWKLTYEWKRSKRHIIENSQHTEKSTGDLRRLAVIQTPEKNHQKTLMWKTLEGNNNIIKRIRSEKKTTLPSLRKQDWRTVKSDTAKVNDKLTNITINDIIDLNDFIYAGAKFVSEKVGVPLKNTDRKSKSEREIKLESLKRKL